MRRASGILLTVLALAGCAGQQSGARETASPGPDKRSIVGVEVTNTFDRSIDVYYGTQFLGTLAPHAHGSYPLAPETTAAGPIYARFTREPDRSYNISRGGTVRYVYANASAGG
jgi:hypothetical protein